MNPERARVPFPQNAGTRVNVPGVGIVSFPAGMTPEQISDAIQNDILAEPRAPSAPAEVAPDWNLLRGIGERAGDVAGGFLQVPGQIAAQLPDLGSVTINQGGVQYNAPGEVSRQDTALYQGGRGLRNLDFGFQPTVSLDDIKQTGLALENIPQIGQFALETAGPSMVDMAAVVANPLAYLAARTGELTEARTDSHGRADPSLSDLGVGAGTAAAVAALERFGADRLLRPVPRGIGAAPGAAQGAVRGLVAEGATEAAQEPLEYAATTPRPEITSRGLADAALAGLIAGGAFGGVAGTASGAVRGAREGTDARSQPQPGPGQPNPSAAPDAPSQAAQAAQAERTGAQGPVPAPADGYAASALARIQQQSGIPEADLAAPLAPAPAPDADVARATIPDDGQAPVPPPPGNDADARRRAPADPRRSLDGDLRPAAPLRPDGQAAAAAAQLAPEAGPENAPAPLSAPDEGPDTFGTRVVPETTSSLRTSVERVTSPEDLAALVLDLGRHAQETVVGTVTDDQGNVLRVFRHSKGGKDRSLVDPMTLAAEAVSVPGGTVLHLAHNHPSGRNAPSFADKRVTQAIEGALDGTGMRLGEHVIVTSQGEATRLNDGPVTPTAGAQTRTVPVTERAFAQREALFERPIDSPQAAQAAIEQIDLTEGVLLLDNQLKAVGAVRMASEELAALREGARVPRLMRALNTTNASNAIVVGSDSEAIANASRFLNRFNDFEVVDAVLNGQSSKASGANLHSAQGPFFRRREASPPAEAGLDLPALEAMVATARKAWPNAPEITVVATAGDLPFEPAHSDVQGVYRDGSVFLIADAIESPARAAQVLLHEVVGHAGLRGLFGGRLDTFLEQVARSADLTPTARRLGLDLATRDGRLVAAEEYVAELAETDPRHRMVDALMTRLRNFVRRVFPRLALSEAELRDVIRRARQRLETPAPPAAPQANQGSATDAPPAPRARPSGTLTLRPQRQVESDYAPSEDQRNARSGRAGDAGRRDWRSRLSGAAPAEDWQQRTRARFGGAPGRLYRGARQPLTAEDFDRAALGGSTAHPSSGLGVFFTRSEGEAARYGAVEAFYLDLRNPKLLHYDELPEFASVDDAFAYREQLRAQGFDGLVLHGADVKAHLNIVAFEPDAVITTEQRLEDDGARYARRVEADEDPFYAENARLKETNVRLWDRAKQELRRQIAPGGLLPSEVFQEKITRDAQFNAVEFDVRHLLGVFEAAVKRHHGKPFSRLAEADKDRLSEALAGRVPDDLPDAVKMPVFAMRQYIDGLSKLYIGALKKEMDALIAQGASEDAMRRAELIGIIVGNIGSYVHRSYQAFDDPAWHKKVPTETYNRARRYLIEQYTPEHGEAEARRKAEVILNELVKHGTAYESFDAAIRESKLGAKDLSVLVQRKDIAPEIRAVLGEYTDPRVNFAKTATKMGRLIWNTSFLNAVRARGLDVFLFQGDRRPPEATSQIAAEGSDVLAPLNGLWTYPEVAQAFNEALGKEQMADWYRRIVQLNGAVKFGKTVLSPTTAARNWQSAAFFTIANGHYDWRHIGKSVAGLREYFTQQGEAGRIAYLRRLQELGVIYDTPYAGEMMRLLEDAQVGDRLLRGDSSFGMRATLRYAQKFYQYGDDFWKIVGFENEKRLLTEIAGLSEADAEVRAAERIRNTYPTYSMVGRLMHFLRRFPLVGTFVSFPAEIVRTSSNMVRYVHEDFQDPATRPLAYRRAAGLAIASGFAAGLGALSRAMFDVDDEEDEALRKLAAPWNRNSDLLYVGRNADGALRYIDLTYLDPYAYWKRPVNAILREQPWEDSAKDALREFAEPFFGRDIGFGALWQAFANQTDTGQPIYSEHDPAHRQVAKLTKHLWGELQPGIGSNLERTYRALEGQIRPGSGQRYDIRDEAWAWLGYRVATFDPKIALYYQTYEFQDAKRDASQDLNRVLRDPNDRSDSDVRQAYERAVEARERAYREMHEIIVAAEKSGLEKGQIAAVLRAQRISKADVKALMTGEVAPFYPSRASWRAAMKRADILFDEDTARQTDLRYRTAAEHAEEISHDDQ